VQACTLVTAADASSATNATLTNPASGAAIPGACFYTSADGKTSVVVYAQVLPDASAAQSFSADTIAAALTGGFGLSNSKVISGIGDKAIEYTTGASSNGIVIIVFKSNVVMLIVMQPSGSNGSSVIEHLATTAIGRVGS
jgi:hypothetical protein